MLNFIFQNPVKIYFGKNQLAALTEEIPLSARILLTYGQGSIKQNGVYKKVMQTLSSHTVFEFAGIHPNPSYEYLRPAIDLVRQKKIDFLLAVGGGSVIDGTKFIAMAALFQGGDAWEIMTRRAKIQSVLPIGCVLTLPAAGSEMNCGLVISKKITRDKLDFMHPELYPKFAILDPTFTYGLSRHYTANGIADAFTHAIEQYLTYPVGASLQDRYAESVLVTLIEVAEKVLAHPDDYEARATLMWAATLAINHTLSCGVPEDWTTHMLGHELTACFGLDHAETLAVLLPNVMRARKTQKREKLLQYADRVWQIKTGSDDEIIDVAILKTSNFFASLGFKLRLGDYGIDNDAIPILRAQLVRHGLTKLSESGDLGIAESENIYRASL